MGLKKLILPVLGIDMESAVVERWLKSEGDPVAKDEPVVVVETDKASTEIVSPADGVLREVLEQAGATVPVTQTIAIIEVEGPGDADERGDERASASLGEGLRESESTRTQPLAPGPQPSTPDSSAVPSKLRASPAARRAARDLGADLSLIKGTGPYGRIQSDDVRVFVSNQSSSIRHQPVQTDKTDQGVRKSEIRAQDSASTQSSGIGPQFSLPGHLVPLSKKRRITAERMSLSARTVARLTMTMEFDASEMIGLRKRLMPVLEREKGVRLSYNDILVKAVATSLKDHPYLNARWTDDSIYLVEPINVGIAVATEDGLVVPVVKDANQKRLVEISATLADLVARAREDRLSLQEMTGGTFTITNLGMYDIDAFTPIVNPPEAAILGVGRIVEKPVGRNGEFVLRPMMGLSLSFDHRVVDGAPAAQFLQRVTGLLKEPYLLI